MCCGSVQLIVVLGAISKLPCRGTKFILPQLTTQYKVCFPETIKRLQILKPIIPKLPLQGN